MERLLHYTWMYKLFPLEELCTTDGRRLEIIDPGLINRDAGPDFFNAKIKLDGILWVGNVELHTRTSDWMKHGHSQDVAYNNVILHVASIIDTEVARADGRLLPQFQLQVPEYVEQNYLKLKHFESTPSCASTFPHLPKLLIHGWLSALQEERMEQKMEAICHRLEFTNQDWERAFFITLARNFGFGLNSDPFEQWAENMPLEALAKHRDNLLQVEAIFFGQAGLLEDPDLNDDYYQALCNEYAYLRHKFNLTPSSSLFKMLRLRPRNFPHLRIAQLAMLYYRKESLFSEVMETELLPQLMKLFQVEVTEYWGNHLHFGCECLGKNKAMSPSSICLILINTVIPFLNAYGKFRGNLLLNRRAERLQEELMPENNRITRTWEAVGIKAQNAADSQALIQLTREYCEKKKCLFCRFGYEFMKGRTE